MLIQAGGNDIMRFTDLKDLEEQIRRTLELSRGLAEAVFMLSTGDVGIAPAFVPPVDWIMSARTRSVRQILLEQAERAGIEYLDLYRDKQNDPFARDPERLHAADGLHPSSAGYAIWYRELVERTSIVEALRGQ